MAFAGRLVVPRVLGEQRYGQLSYIESITLLVTTLLALGADTYIRIEVANRPERALDFARPLAQIRATAGVVLAVGFAAGFGLTSDRLEIGLVAMVFGLGQLAVVLGQTQASYLHAVHRVGAVSASAIVSKFLWLVVLLTLLGSGVRLLAVPIAMLAAEIFRNLWLRRAFRRELGVPHRAPWSSAVRVVRSSLPFYVDSINLAFNNYTVPIILGIVASDREVGLLAAATTAITVPMFFAPVLSWVLTPTLSNLNAVDPSQMWRRTAEFLDATFVTVCVAAAAVAGLAGPVMRLLFGGGFGDGGAALAVLAVGMPATFLAMVLAIALSCDGRGWVVAKVNLATMLAMVALAFAAVLFGRRHGDGAAALGGAIGITVAEWITPIVLWAACRPGRPTRRRLLHLGVTIVGGAGLAVAGLTSSPVLFRSLGVSALGLAVALEAPALVRTARDVLLPRGEPDASASSG